MVIAGLINKFSNFRKINESSVARNKPPCQVSRRGKPITYGQYCLLGV